MRRKLQKTQRLRDGTKHTRIGAKEVLMLRLRLNDGLKKGVSNGVIYVIELKGVGIHIKKILMLIL